MSARLRWAAAISVRSQRHKLTLLNDAQIDDKINDSYFTKEASKRSKGSEKEFFGKDKSAEKEKKAFPSDKADDQKTIDKALIAEIQKTENLAKYLGSSFGLSKGQFPHQLKF
jgi:large subunit ribosomal protein L6e